ncbi:MAG: thioredoxin family protein [Candidatus Hydrogenedentes bacterium]|nr:thioredoxin family protein [Candidatus Hydrogenedentota bacterium]
MPRPPILPTIDWESVFESGKTYQDWLAAGEVSENCQRMEALRKELSLEPYMSGLLAALTRPVHIIAIAEDWCGDVVRHVPGLQKLADDGPNIKVRYIRRDQHPDVFARFLTNGGEAIPKFIFLSPTFVECGNWGPMPDACRALIARGKACGDVPAARKKVSALYEADSDERVVMEELLKLIETAAASRP